MFHLCQLYYQRCTSYLYRFLAEQTHILAHSRQPWRSLDVFRPLPHDERGHKTFRTLECFREYCQKITIVGGK